MLFSNTPATGVYTLKCNDCPKFYIGQTGRSLKTRYTEHIEALTLPFIKSNFAEHIFNSHHTYTNIETNLEILHILPKVRINLLLFYFTTVVPSNSCVFLSCRPFVVNTFSTDLVGVEVSSVSRLGQLIVNSN